MNEYHLHGPPGCGKTHALATSWVPRAVDRFGPDAVLIASLTKTAATEVAGRVPLKPERVGTLHAHAFRALSSPTVAQTEHAAWNELFPQWALGGGSGDEADREAALERAKPGTPLLEALSIERHRMTDPSTWSPEVRRFGDAYTAWKREADLVDFDDMIELALEDVTSPPGGAEVLIVDEAQDCSKLELALVRKWSLHADHLVLAGDGDQAIFEWRGADAAAFLGGDIPDSSNYKLTQSYRVPRAVHAHATRWISRAVNRYAVDYQPRDHLGAVETAPCTYAYPDGVVDRAKRKLEADPEATVMILGTCARHLTPTVRRLRELGIPFHNPYRPEAGAWNPMRGGVARLRAFLAGHPDGTQGAPRLWTVRELAQWVELLSAQWFDGDKGARVKRIKAEAKAQAKRTEIGPVTDTYLRELLGERLDEELGELFATRGVTHAVKWLEGNILSSKTSLMSFAMRMVRMHGVGALEAVPRIVVGTVHSVKGGQADHVFLFPDVAVAAGQRWLLGHRDPILRLFYVGMTRARDTLTLFHPKDRAYAPLQT